MKTLIIFLSLIMTQSLYAEGQNYWHNVVAPAPVGPCGQGSQIGYCALMHTGSAFDKHVSPHYRAIQNSKHPEVSVDKYRQIEKQFAARGEPLNSESLLGLMSHLATYPQSKCGFDQLSKKSGGGYGLSCSSPNGKKSEYPGLSEKFLNEEFADNSLNPPVQEVEEEKTIVAEQPVQQPEVVGTPEEEITIADSAVALPTQEVRNAKPVTIANDSPTGITGLPDDYKAVGIR